MNKRKPNNLLRLIIGGFVALIVLVAVTYPLWIPYFVDDVVDEAFPTSSAETSDTQVVEQAATAIQVEADTSNTDMSEDTQVDTIAETASEPVALLQGSFSFIDSIHNGSGTGTIFELPDGSRVLRFENFEVTNGPDLHVILSPETPEGLTDGVGDYVDLGSLKGNIGNQNYDIPADVNLADYASIVIYCQPFHVVFSSATLSPAQ